MGAVALLLVAVVLGAARWTSSERLAAWQADCRARGASVQTVDPAAANPLVTESKDPAYHCRAADGRVMASWR